MLRGVSAGVAVVAMLVLAAVGLAAPTAFGRCHGSSGVLCAKVKVPLDWSGTTPGSISLSVEELPAIGKARGVMMLVAGGPGQASAVSFDLARYGGFYRFAFPGYTLVAFDPRGTGASGALGCTLNATATIDVDPTLIQQCADSIGPNRVFYTTAANVQDLEAVRRVLAVDKVAIFGVSYGTKVALAYAAAQPTHVERLLLDSVLAPTGPDPFNLDLIQGMPAGLSSLCTIETGCRALTPNLPAQVATLANRAAVKPLKGTVLSETGVPLHLAADGPMVLAIVRGSDLDDGIRAELPSAIAAASAGRPKQLLRLESFLEGGFQTAAGDSSEGDFLATTCNDGRFPWQPSAAFADRQHVLASAIASLPAAVTGPFGSWAATSGTADICLSWPSPAGNAALSTGPYPDVPVLALSGSLDFRTPTAEAASTVAQFPHGHLLVVPGVGHSVLSNDLDGCVPQAIRLWLRGGTPPTRCPAEPPLVALVPLIPATVRSARPAPGTIGLRGRTLTAAAATIKDAVATWTSSSYPVAGLDGGDVSGLGDLRLSLFDYSDIPGLTLNGNLSIAFRFGGRKPSYTPIGTIAVTGRNATHGRIRLLETGAVRATWASAK